MTNCNVNSLAKKTTTSLGPTVRYFLSPIMGGDVSQLLRIYVMLDPKTQRCSKTLFKLKAINWTTMEISDFTLLCYTCIFNVFN